MVCAVERKQQEVQGEYPQGRLAKSGIWGSQKPEE
jgi:hypothetical protein